jgi:hypothetical protein
MPQCNEITHYLPPLSHPSNLRQGYGRQADPTEWPFQMPPSERTFKAIIPLHESFPIRNFVSYFLLYASKLTARELFT